MKVLVIGATGFIGLPIAQALVRAGHIVYGQTRSQAKAQQLATEEIIPVVGPTNEPHKWLQQPFVASLDAIINAVGGYEIMVLYPLLVNAIEEAAAKLRAQNTPKLTFIHTWGTWAYGNSTTNIISDTSPADCPPNFVAWGAEIEQKVINSKILNGIVIRAGLLYGRSASHLSRLFKSAHDGQVTWFGSPHTRWSLIHCDDLADLYVRATEKASFAGGNIFTGANDITESVGDIVNKLTEVSGATKSPTYMEPTNPFEEALVTSQVIRPYLGRSLLGWQPRKPGLVDNMEVYYNSWKASTGL